MVFQAMQLEEFTKGMSIDKQERKECQDLSQDDEDKTPKETEKEHSESKRETKTRRVWQPEAMWRQCFKVEWPLGLEIENHRCS